MASGGGRHPSHLPITTPPSTRSHSGSLQTPDASTLFLSSLGEGGGSGGNTNSFANSSPLDNSQAFSSLEELLNVTGISSLELDQLNGSQERRDGVDSLQQIAKEVESGYGTLIIGTYYTMNTSLQLQMYTCYM